MSLRCCFGISPLWAPIFSCSNPSIYYAGAGQHGSLQNSALGSTLLPSRKRVERVNAMDSRRWAPERSDCDRLARLLASEILRRSAPEAPTSSRDHE